MEHVTEKTQHGGLPFSLAIIPLAIALLGAGWLIGHGIQNTRSYERFVTVKGLSERSVVADRAVWPITFVATNDDLQTAQRKITADTSAVRAFLTDSGIQPEEIEVQNLLVQDQMAQSYRSGPITSRYTISQTLLVRSTNIQGVRQATQEIGRLIEAGVIFGGQSYQTGPSYLYTGLNTVKTEMIAEATANARQSALQFARDAQSDLGTIRRANQGVFQILAADGAANIREESQINKTVRVVVTLEYFLTR